MQSPTRPYICAVCWRKSCSLVANCFRPQLDYFSHLLDHRSGHLKCHYAEINYESWKTLSSGLLGRHLRMADLTQCLHGHIGSLALTWSPGYCCDHSFLTLHGEVHSLWLFTQPCGSFVKRRRKEWVNLSDLPICDSKPNNFYIIS